MEDYEKRYYEYQTTARGLLSARALELEFSKRAKWYRAMLGKYLPTDRSSKCLDVPCGFGNFLYFLRQQGFSQSIGYDLDPNQIRLARMLNLPAIEGDAFSILVGKRNEYACITSLDFLEHLSKNRALEFVAACKAALIPGGVLIVRTPSADGPFGAHDLSNDLTHQWAPTANVLQHIFEMHGFSNVRILDERPQPYKLLNWIRLFSFYAFRAVASLCCTLLGELPPRVWSRSMWGIGIKPLEQQSAFQSD